MSIKEQIRSLSLDPEKARRFGDLMFHAAHYGSTPVIDLEGGKKVRIVSVRSAPPARKRRK